MVVDEVYRANRNLFVILLRNIVENPENSYAQVRLSAKKKEDEIFQPIVYVIYKLEEIIYLLDVMTSVCDRVITIEPICDVLQKVVVTVYSVSFFLSQDELEHCR